MPVFTVHAPVDGGADLAATDKFTFVRDGFHFWAMVASVLWLVWHRLWLALIGWIVVAVVLEAGLIALGAGRGAILFADLMVALLMGLEAASLQTDCIFRLNVHYLPTPPWQSHQLPTVATRPLGRMPNDS